MKNQEGFNLIELVTAIAAVLVLFFVIIASIIAIIYYNS